MTYTDLQIELLEIGLSIKDLANLLGMNPNSITNYKRTKVIPLNLAITISLISYLKKTGITPENIINEIKKKHAADLIENQQLSIKKSRLNAGFLLFTTYSEIFLLLEPTYKKNMEAQHYQSFYSSHQQKR